MLKKIFHKIRKSVFHLYFRLKRPMTLGVRIIAINDKNELCLIKHTYISGWHLPGGGVERGETARSAAIKEAYEEAGLIVEPIDMELISIHENFEYFKGDHILLYRAKYWTETQSNKSHNALEIAEAKFFPLDKLPPETTGGTHRRILELHGILPKGEKW